MFPSFNSHLKLDFVPVNSCPNDTISQIAWGKKDAEILLGASSWDKTLRIWGLKDLSTVGKPEIREHVIFYSTAPILSCFFMPDSNSIFAGGCDNSVTVYDLSRNDNTGTVIGKHDQPVKSLAWIKHHNLVASASWDGKLSFWDGKSPNPVNVFDTNSKIFAMDNTDEYLMIATARREIIAYELRNFSMHSVDLSSKNILQIRDIAVLPNFFNPAVGLALCTIDGKLDVFTDSFSNTIAYKIKDFRFKSSFTEQKSGDTNVVYGNNCVDFSTRRGLLTAGSSNGTITIFDIETRKQHAKYNVCNNAITALKYHPSMPFLAYAEGYDWAMGYDPTMVSNATKLYVHQFKQSDPIVAERVSAANNFR